MRALVLVGLLTACSSSGVELQNHNMCSAAACPNRDPVHGLAYGGEIASCNIDVVLSDGKHASCYMGLSFDTGICAPDPASVSFYDPAPPAGYVVASSCDECARVASICN